MEKEKLTLEALKAQGLVTTLSEEQMGQLKGGYTIVKGRRYNFRTRWTSVDVRGEYAELSQIGPING